MRELIRPAIATATSLNQVYDGLISVCDQIYEQRPNAEIFYPSGCITSKGPHLIADNKARLNLNTQALRTFYNQPGFSAVDVFNWDLMGRLGYPEKVVETDLKFFWREVLCSGRIKKVVMTPGYEISSGAIDELRAANQLGIPVDYLMSAYYCIDAEDQKPVFANLQIRESTILIPKKRFSDHVVSSLLAR